MGVNYVRSMVLVMKQRLIRKEKGFTLIEMLVVIAIIAILVAIIVPTITKAQTKAKAATDAANLRTVLGIGNTALVSDSVDMAAAFANAAKFECETFSGADAWIAYQAPGFIQAYYVDGSNYYSLEYFSEVAEKGTSTKILTTQPAGYTWYPVGTGGGSGE